MVRSLLNPSVETDLPRAVIFPSSFAGMLSTAVYSDDDYRQPPGTWASGAWSCFAARVYVGGGEHILPCVSSSR